MEILYLILGWLLGLLSPSITDAIKRTYSKNQLLDGIKTELKECQFRALLATYLLGLRYGKYDREYLIWCLKYLENYNGLEPKENTVKITNSLLGGNDEDIDKLIAVKRATEKDIGLNLKRFSLLFLDSKISEVSIFSINLQNIIYEIRARLQIVNEEIDNTTHYFNMTFDSSISGENYERIKNNLSQKYLNLQSQLIILIKKMDRLLEYQGKI